MTSMFKYIISTFILLSCASSPVTDSAAETGSKQRIIHDVSYRNKGSRSESRSGYLTIDGIILPDCFNMVLVDDKAYVFFQRSLRWGNDGYFPSEDEKYSPLRKIDKMMTDSDIARGWCNSEGIMKNMPNGWIFVKWESGSALVLPSKISVLIAEKKIKPLPRLIIGR